MKKILLISDTHNFLDPKLLKHIEQADEVWHGGDIGTISICDTIEKIKPLNAVFGNVDGQDIRSTYPENLMFNCEDLKVLITHIGGYPGKYSSRIKNLITEHKPGLFICGHSHILKVMFDKENNLLHINPGACGVHGFHKVKTAVRFEVDKKEIKNLAVIELGARASLN
ncbi:MAG: calcineurin-like phosphoesterase superfamily domain protein [Bacteroidetes bacterium]|nr:calcineurin-like phosphoesterase superfamily domain protein [Bacteroidota bacterium]